MKKITKNINYLWIIVLLIYMLIGSFLICYGKLKLTTYANGFYILNIITLILCIINYIKHKKINITDISILFLIIIAIITTLICDYKKISIWGHTTRCEGMIMLICYYLIFVLSTFVKSKDKKKIVRTILILGVIQVVIGILQQLGIMQGVHNHYSKGLVGNSNYYSTQNLIWLGLSLGMFIFDKKWINIILVIIFSIGLSIGGAMSCFVGLVCVIISILFIIIYNRQYIDLKNTIKKYIISLFAIALTFVLVSTVVENPLINDIKELLFESSDIIINHNIESSYGTNRIFIWENTIPKIKDYFIVGVGIDCFRYIFKPLLKNNGIISKAHNEYLQLLITEGIFCLIFYLLLLSTTILNNFERIRKKEYTYFDYAILLCVIGYITQAFFNISVIRVAPIFYIVLGLCYKRKEIQD